jgi:flavin-dependent dehydrogenase
VGDAAGYVEPFTGEGMGWALWGALALAPFVHAGVERWDEALLQRWDKVHRRRIRQGQRICRIVAWGLRRPWMARAAVRVFGAVPVLARPLVTHTTGSPRLQTGRPW